jgi:hypothetical protein
MSTRRDFLRATGAFALALGSPTVVATPSAAPPSLPEPAMPTAAHDPRRDFDFFHGRWTVENRRLRQRHADADAWEEFPGTLDCRPLLGGLGNIDEYRSHDVHGLSLRLFDPATRQWSDRWASARDGQLGEPALGTFAGGVGTFLGRDTHAGRPVLNRMLWRDLSPDGFTWEQAGSLDEGASWETNWVMRIRRAG